MVWRRMVLLIFGLAGSLAAAFTLYISVQNTQAVGSPPESVTQSSCIAVTLPTGVPGTALIAHRLSAYDGPFPEDSSNREVFGVAALPVYNGGSKLLSVRVQLTYPDGVYTFTGDHIPPGCWVLLLEEKGKPHRGDAPLSCTGSQRVLNDSTEFPVHTEDTRLGVRICNAGDKTLRGITICYKTWLPDPGMYIGGITYQLTVPMLAPGEWVELQPDHYAPGYSKVVSISGRK